jgi:hypothetical protein
MLRHSEEAMHRSFTPGVPIGRQGPACGAAAVGYRVMYETRGGSLMRALIAAAVLALGFVTSAPAQAQNRFWLVNNAPETIMEAYVSPSRISQWGPDILGTGVLPSGQRVWVTPNFGDCVLDVRIVYQSRREETRMGLNACSVSTVAFGGGGAVGQGTAGATVTPNRPQAQAAQGNPSFTLVNGTGQVIREVYASLSSQGNWGPDRLGANVLQPGQSLAISLPMGGGCLTDIRIVMMNGASRDVRGRETCSLTSLTIQ